jgi:hypothetical protein
MSLWGRNNGMWASYQIQQNQNRSIYADYAIQQERIAQGCQTINKTSNVAAVNSGSVVTSLKEGSQDYTCTEKAQCLARASCPVPPPPPPYVAGPGQAVWANMITTNSNTSTNTFSLRAVTTDSSGNVYVTGFGQDASGTTVNIPIYDYITTTNNQIILRESTTVPPITFLGIGYNKAILIKYNKDGIAQWAVNFDGEESAGFGVVCDSSGNVYVTTRAYGIPSIPIKVYNMNTSGIRDVYGTITNTTNSFLDIIIIKYDTNGTAQYVSACGNVVSITEFINTPTTPIAIDSSGNISYIFYTNGDVNIYNGITPTSGGILDFNAAPEFLTISKGLATQVGIIVRADSNLQILNATKISGSSASGTGSDAAGVSVILNSVCMDSSGNTIVCGNYSGTTTTNYLRIWNNLASTLTGYYGGTTMNANIANSFIIKYDTSFLFLGMAAIVSTAQSEIGQNITVDSSGNIYSTANLTVASTTSSIQVYSNINNSTKIISTTVFSTLTTITGPIVLIIKYAPDLKSISLVTYIEPTITSVFRPSAITSYGITLDANNNMYIGVVFNGGTMTVNNSVSAPLAVAPFVKVTNRTPAQVSTTWNNAVIIKYNSNFQGQWATTLDSGINVSVNGLSLYYDMNTNSIYTSGVFNNYYGNLNIQNFNRVSGGNLITDYYANMSTTPFGLASNQGRGFIVKYAA